MYTLHITLVFPFSGFWWINFILFTLYVKLCIFLHLCSIWQRTIVNNTVHRERHVEGLCDASLGLRGYLAEGLISCLAVWLTNWAADNLNPWPTDWIMTYFMSKPITGLLPSRLLSGSLMANWPTVWPQTKWITDCLETTQITTDWHY